jgi:hypothetical protein
MLSVADPVLNKRDVAVGEEVEVRNPLLVGTTP